MQARVDAGRDGDRRRESWRAEARGATFSKSTMRRSGQSQVARLAQIRRASRRWAEVRGLARQHWTAVRAGDGNLPAPAVAACARPRDARRDFRCVEAAFGRYQAPHPNHQRHVRESENGPKRSRPARAVARSAAESGRRPRLLIAKLAQDGHDRGAKVSYGVRRSRLRRDAGPAFPDPTRGRRDGDRQRRRCRRRFIAGGRPPDAHPAVDRGAARSPTPVTSRS